MVQQEHYHLIEGDCLEVFNQIEDQSIDFILCDPPYGVTACKWDQVIPIEPMWKQIWRVLKPDKVVTLFGREPFSSLLRVNQLDAYKYDWIWNKTRGTNFYNAKLRPISTHEIISVFSKGSIKPNGSPYYPQGLQPCNKTLKNSMSVGGESANMHHLRGKAYVQTQTNYPKTVLQFGHDETGKVHPTQKPLALLEYLVKTYTNEGETVLDFTMGSGSTGVACLNTGRKFIGIEKDPKYFELAKNRLGEGNNNNNVVS